MMTFDAVILADSPHAQTVLLGLTLVERARRVAGRVGARRIFVVDGPAAAARLAGWESERGDAGLLVLRGGDRLVHPPLANPLLEGTRDRRIAVGPTGAYAGAAWATGEAARELIAAIGRAPSTGDLEIVERWTDAERIPHGEIAVHLATTPAERKAATRMLLRILTKADEDSPVSKYIYRPLSKPLTRLLLHTPITPNQVTIIVGVIGLVGCWLTAQPTYQGLVWGALLVFASGILDGCDGEIARLKLTSSPLGAWLDTIVDEVTSVAYFVAIGYHTYALHPELWIGPWIGPWIGATVVAGTLAYVLSIYGIYYFCIVVLKAGGSQYYVGTLDVVEDGLRARPRAPSDLAPWLRAVGQWMLYVIRRDFINLAAVVLALLDAYAVIYAGILVGALVSGTIITREHLRLRGQLRELARRGLAPRLVA